MLPSPRLTAVPLAWLTLSLTVAPGCTSEDSDASSTSSEPSSGSTTGSAVDGTDTGNTSSDSGAEATPAAAGAACKASCATQFDACPTLDLTECEALCDYVVGLIEDDATCLALGITSWTCDLELEWECDPTTDVVGQPVNATPCAAESSAFDDAGCSGEAETGPA